MLKGFRLKDKTYFNACLSIHGWYQKENKGRKKETPGLLASILLCLILHFKINSCGLRGGGQITILHSHFINLFALF